MELTPAQREQYNQDGFLIFPELFSAQEVAVLRDEVQRIASSPRAVEYESRLRPLCKDTTIVRIDRAEPNKNVIRGFRAFELLLSRHPELHRKVTFLAFLVPSRTHIRQYQRYMDEIQ